MILNFVYVATIIYNFIYYQYKTMATYKSPQYIPFGTPRPSYHTYTEPNKFTKYIGKEMFGEEFINHFRILNL